MEQAKREHILSAAGKSFARFGFKKSSIEEIARDAGVAKGTVYLACESKEDLYYQVLHREVRAWVAECARLIDPRVPADQLLVLTSNSGVQYLEKHPLVRDLFFRASDDGVMPGWQKRLDELRELGLANIIEILRLGVKQGQFRSEIDLEEVARILQDLQIATYLFHDRPGPNRAERLERRGRAGFDLVLHGLRAGGRVKT